jgi:hypothetical protein
MQYIGLFESCAWISGHLNMLGYARDYGKENCVNLQVQQMVRLQKLKMQKSWMRWHSWLHHQVTMSLQCCRQTLQARSWPYFLSLVTGVFWSLSVVRAFILVHGVLEDLLQCKVSLCKYCTFVQGNAYCVNVYYSCVTCFCVCIRMCETGLCCLSMLYCTFWQGWSLKCLQKMFLLEG